MAKGKKKKFYKRLKNKFRLVLMDDENFEEKISLVLSPLNVFTWGGLTFILLAALLTGFIAFTPIREFIPGYSSPALQKYAMFAALKADSLEQIKNKNERYLNDIKMLFENKTIRPDISTNKDTTNYAKITLTKSKEDSVLRTTIETEDKYNLLFNKENSTVSTMSNFFFFSPLQGIVSQSFDPKDAHFGVDIVANQNEAIMATLDGTVIIATWTSETGYIIELQHENNLISIYKHNSVLLKKAGDYVKAGEVIAIIGESGEFTNGPHLHFELWLNGRPINPEEHITF